MQMDDPSISHSIMESDYIAPPYRGRPFRPRFGGARRKPAKPSDRHIMDGLRPEMIRQLSKPTTDIRAQIADLHYVGSYNWLDKKTPTIIVPGSPRQWKNRATPYQVQPDPKELRLKDQNGFRCPNSVLLPLITAVNWMDRDKKFDWKAIDFVTDRNNLRKLLRWFGDGTDEFRIDMQFTGNAVLFNRWEDSYHVKMSGKTFGFNFETASTDAVLGCEDSTGHHRIVQYNFSGLTLVVRFEVDACISSDASPVSTSVPNSRTSTLSDNLDHLIGAMSSVSLSTRSETNPAPSTISESHTFPNVTIIPGGSVVAQTAVLELTTRSSKAAEYFRWKEAYPQLYLSGTPHYFIGVHESGRFKEVMKRKLESAELEEIANDCQADLRALRALLDTIKGLAVEHGVGARLSLVCREGELGVYERVSKASCLPDQLLELFEK